MERQFLTSLTLIEMFSVAESEQRFFVRLQRMLRFGGDPSREFLLRVTQCDKRPSNIGQNLPTASDRVDTSDDLVSRERERLRRE